MERQQTNGDFRTIGRPSRLLGGLEKVSGRAQYATDLTRPGMLHCRLLLSPYAHARIRAIETAEAAAVPGVVRIVTAADLPPIEPTGRHRLLLARDEVLFVGHPVAAVLAESEAAAQDALEQILVDYEVLPAATTIEQATAPNAPLVWPGGEPGSAEEAAAHGADVGAVETNVAPSNLRRTSYFTRGDVDAAFDEAERAGGVIVEYHFKTPVVHQSYIEPHATLAEVDPLTGTATVWTSTQAQFYVREEVAAILGLAETDVRVVPMVVGGGFGGKFILTEPLVALLAQVSNRPVRLILSRGDEFLSGNPAPQSRIEVKAAAMPDGSLHAIRAKLLFDAGIFGGTPGGIGSYLLGSYYKCPHLEIESLEVLTHKLSTGAYRGPGAPQATWAIESVVDELAARLGIDPLEFRLKNCVNTGDPDIRGRLWPEIGLRQCLETLAAHPAWEEARRESEPNVGWGLAIGGWMGGLEPASATCMLQRDGTFSISVGAVDLTGTNTTLALIAAEVLGLPPERIKITTLDTDRAPYAGATGGSKITYTVGAAVLAAARAARDQLLNLAAEQLEAAPEDLELADGFVQVRGVPESRRSLAEIASSTMKFGGKYAPVFASANTATTTQAPSLAAHLARVRVDPETGEVTVLRYIAVHDIGRALNPPAVRGQIQGGVTQGLGWALHEEMIFDEDGQLLTASLMDYALPKTNNIPPSGIETVLVEVPSPEGPFGARPIGEPPVIPVPGAIANAVRAATGVRVTEIPITAARLWAQLHTKSETAVTGVAKDRDEAGGSISTFTSDDGQGLLEYALILVLVAVVVIAILVLLGPEINSIMSRIAPWLSGQ